MKHNSLIKGYKALFFGICLSLSFGVPAFALVTTTPFLYVTESDHSISDDTGNEAMTTLSFDSITSDTESASVIVSVNPHGISVNAVSLVVGYDKESLVPTGIDNTDSDFSLFFVEYIDQEKGLITITYIEPYPGVDRKSTVAKILFTKKKSSGGSVYFDGSSQVLANDGEGTNLLWKGEDAKL